MLNNNTCAFLRIFLVNLLLETGFLCDFFDPKYVIFMWSKMAKCVVERAKYDENTFAKKPQNIRNLPKNSQNMWFKMA